MAAPEQQSYDLSGRCKVVWEGRCILGPDRRTCLVSVGLIVAPVTAFCVVVTPGPVATVIVLLLAVITLTFLTITACSDPGIIPKNPTAPEDLDRESPPGEGTDIAEEDSANPGEPQVSLSDVASIIPTMSPPVRTYPRREREETVNGIKVKRKYCDTCHVLRPLRASHCPFCDACVMRHDHHCPWTGTCIGERNYRFFFGFVYSSTILSMLVAGFSLVELIRGMVTQHEEGLNGLSMLIGAAQRTRFVSLILLVYTAVTMCSVGGLAGFHTYLCCTGQTTHEEMRKRKSQGNPYNEGCCRNCWRTFAHPIPPSQVRLRYLEIMQTPHRGQLLQSGHQELEELV